MVTGMPMPTVRTTLVDPHNNNVYHVMAYRPLSRPELLTNVQMFVSGLRRKPKKGKAYTILTIIGSVNQLY